MKHAEAARPASTPRNEQGPYDETQGVGEIVVGPLGEKDDAQRAAQLFRDTVHAVCARDYTSAQLRAWAPGSDTHRNAVAAKLMAQHAVAARECGIMVGFGSLDAEGALALDMLFVHKDRQGQGVGSLICDALEQAVAADGHKDIATFSSITARPFFERRGYRVVRENVVERDGERLVNYLMRKSL